MRTLVMTAALVVCSATHADNWPSWRGPTGLGVSAEKNLPLQWSPTENVRWKVKLPAPGNSTPIIWGDRVFITQANDVTKWPPKVPANFAGGSSAGGHAIAEKRSVMCFDRKDGKLLWQRDVIYKDAEITHPTNPFCSASPVTDGERVIAHHGSAGLVCYDFDGKELWRHDHGKIEHLWGTASSPILHGDLCIQWCGPGDRQFLLAVNKRTGEKVWERIEEGGDAGITTKKFLGSWSTPIIARIGEQDQLVFAVPGKIKGYDPLTGKDLWWAKGPGSYCYSSPLFFEGHAVFNGSLFKAGGAGDITKQQLKHKLAGMYISTAAVQGDFVYTYNNGVAGCFEWKTGTDVWKKQIAERSGGTSAWGSPIVADGRMYIIDQDGATFVFGAGAKYEVLAASRLNERCNATLAVAQGNFFIRTHKHLWCIGAAK